METITNLLPVLGIMGPYILFTINKRNSDKKEHQETIHKFQVTLDDHTLRHQSHQQEREKLADSMLQRFQNMESRVSQVDHLMTKVSALEIKQEAISIQLSDLKERIKELTEAGKESTREILELIKKGK